MAIANTAYVKNAYKNAAYVKIEVYKKKIKNKKALIRALATIVLKNYF